MAGLGKFFDGWRGVGLVAVTYIYFLIFAQFGFLKRLADLGIAGDHLKIIMGAMAAGGIATSLLAARLEGRWLPARRLQLGFCGCAVGAILPLLPMNLPLAILVAGMIGAALGLLTVTLVAHLNLWIGNVQPLFKIGLGVGLAYFVCNCPQLFDASSAVMASFATGISLAGAGLAARNSNAPTEDQPPSSTWSLPPFWLVLASFTALVWLDSAAFFIIQHSPALKAGTWEGSQRLWQIGGVHFAGALISGALLARRGLFPTLAIAFGLLGFACLLLAKSGSAQLASVCYPLGVSLYSVALVAYPAYLAGRISPLQKLRMGGRLYAVAGWLGSALGIGMAENLRRIPPAFVFAAAVFFFVPPSWNYLRTRRRELLTTAILLLAAWGSQHLLSAWTMRTAVAPPASLVERGRQIYIAEGCLHCHSQYVRPDAKDEIMWGPATDVVARRNEQPPLIGNRRQGPDLSEVGNRRSALWLRAHFMNPARLSHNSPMPAYAYLFADERGEALLAYVQSLGATNLGTRWEIIQKSWHAPEPVVSGARGPNGLELLQKHCATCHDANGAARQGWKSQFKRLPPDFVSGPFVYVPLTAPPDWRFHRIEEIIKFGLPGTDMPGREYLPDAELAALAEQLVHLSQTTNALSAPRPK